MRVPLQIAFHELDHSDAVEEKIREKVGRLETLCDYLNSCRVAVERHHRNNSFHVRIDVTVPGDELVVKRDKDGQGYADVYIAVRESFAIMERQVQDYVTRNRRSERRTAT